MDLTIQSSVVTESPSIVRLEFTSTVEMLDLVQVVADHLTREIGLDEDAAHGVDVALRESVVNAITHGNQQDPTKRVFVEFDSRIVNGVRRLTISVRDEGEGFDPDVLADPLAPENILKSSGRGIFLIKSFMDDVRLRRAPEGGMEIRMTRRVQSPGPGRSQARV